MRASHLVLVGLAGVALAVPASCDRTPRSSGSSVGPESAVYTERRGALAAKLVMRPSFPEPGQPVRFELEAWDGEGGSLALGLRPDAVPGDHGVQPARCLEGPGESHHKRTEDRTFERPGTYEARLVVVAERCDDSQAILEVQAPVVVVAPSARGMG